MPHLFATVFDCSSASHVSDAIERTHRLTGMPHDEIVRRGLILEQIPMYGVAGALTMGGLAAQDRYGED